MLNCMLQNIVNDLSGASGGVNDLSGVANVINNMLARWISCLGSFSHLKVMRYRSHVRLRNFVLCNDSFASSRSFLSQHL